MNKIRRQISERPWILAVVVSLLVILWMYSGSFEPQQLKTTQTVAAEGGGAGVLTRVQVKNQVAEEIIRYISVYGQTAPARTITISAETEGRVEHIGAGRGTQLRKGDVILRLDLRDREARLAQTKASVNEHRTSYEAQLKLKSDGYVSDTQIAETVARLETARAELIRAELDLEHRVIRAPFVGVLQEREVEIGDFVRAGDDVATFVDNTKIIVPTYYPIIQLFDLSVGGNVIIQYNKGGGAQSTTLPQCLPALPQCLPARPRSLLARPQSLPALPQCLLARPQSLQARPQSLLALFPRRLSRRVTPVRQGCLGFRGVLSVPKLGRSGKRLE